MIEDILNRIKHVDASIKPGDYVLATKFSDADPRDRWRVDYVGNIDETNNLAVYFAETGFIPFRFCTKISGDEGAYIINHWKDFK